MRHRVSTRVLGAGGLRSDVEHVLAGGEPTIALRQELDSLSMVPLCEEVVEGPHATMQREARRALAGRRAWHSASLRLEQNLAEVDGLDGPAKEVLDREWRSAKRVAQVRPALQHRPRKVRWADACVWIYRTSLADLPHFEPGTRASAAPLMDQVPRPQVLVCQREWIRAVVKQGGFYSLGEGAVPDCVFQVIDLPGARKVPHGARDPAAEMVCECGILQLQGLRAEGASPSGSGRRLHVVALSGVVARVDLLKLTSWTCWRNSLLRWDPKEGQGGGVRLLADPATPEPELGELGLLYEQAPVALLLEELARQG